MEFLYSLNRLNVATSRAQCACILVASPRLFEPECKSPRQMQLANALCRYVELANVVTDHGEGGVVCSSSPRSDWSETKGPSGSWAPSEGRILTK